MFRSRIYLDFDGVVNAKKPPHDTVESFTIQIEGSRFLAPVCYITFSPTVVQRLDSFRETYGVELVWLSTWNERKDVLKLSNHLQGLHDGRVIEPVLNANAKNKLEWTQWKADAIIADQKQNPLPFVWVDDNAHRFHGDNVALEVATVPCVFVTPESLWGLTTNDLNQIEFFFNNLT